MVSPTWPHRRRDSQDGFVLSCSCTATRFNLPGIGQNSALSSSVFVQLLETLDIVRLRVSIAGRGQQADCGADGEQACGDDTRTGRPATYAERPGSAASCSRPRARRRPRYRQAHADLRAAGPSCRASPQPRHVSQAGSSQCLSTYPNPSQTLAPLLWTLLCGVCLRFVITLQDAYDMRCYFDEEKQKVRRN